MAMTIDASTTQVVTLDELKDFVNVSSGTSDAELLMMLDAAVEAVEGIVGPILHRTVVERVRANAHTIALRESPVVSVTSITSAGSAVTYSLDAATGLLLDVYSAGDNTVTYVAGRTSVPEAIRLAVLIIAGHLWRTQLGSAPANSLQGADEFTPDIGLGYAIPSRAQDLLAPYALPPTVA